MSKILVVLMSSLLFLAILAFLPQIWAYATKPPVFEQPTHAPGVQVVDFADHDLGVLSYGQRVVELFDGKHFDEVLQDTPDEMRPPSIVLFFGHKTEGCLATAEALKYVRTAETMLPARERLFIAKYNLDAARNRTWFEFTPEMDLAKRYGVTDCPTLAYFPRSCSGFTDWCVDPSTKDAAVKHVGCEDFAQHCDGVELLSGAELSDPKKPWHEWVLERVYAEDEPKISPFFKTYIEQGTWIKRRDATTSVTQGRNSFLAQGFPAFTDTGFKAMETPKPVQDFMVNFWKKKAKALRRTEHWECDATQLSFHERPTSFIDLDRVRREKEQFANTYIKPIVEEWSGIKPLELTSFYGIREYHEGHFLRNHVDRIDTHVISVTFCVGKANETNPDVLLDADFVKKNNQAWPLEVVSWDGKMYRYDHLPGTMVLYESSKLAHGRPYRNPPGSVHLGAFLHFKPKQMHAGEAKTWDGVVDRARANLNRYYKLGRYRSSKTVEPKRPVYTKVAYGKGSNWKHLDVNGNPVRSGNEPAEDPNAAQIHVANNSGRRLTLHWDGTKFGMGVVLQGEVSSGDAMPLGTTNGHVFFWSEIGDETPLPGGKFTVEAGKKRYEYDHGAAGEL